MILGTVKPGYAEVQQPRHPNFSFLLLLCLLRLRKARRCNSLLISYTQQQGVNYLQHGQLGVEGRRCGVNDERAADGQHNSQRRRPPEHP